jgi:hypothetical protein
MQRLEILGMLRENSRIKFPNICEEVECEGYIIQTLKILKFWENINAQNSWIWLGYSRKESVKLHNDNVDKSIVK